jgi:hypothetical protein
MTATVTRVPLLEWLRQDHRAKQRAYLDHERWCELSLAGFHCYRCEHLDREAEASGNALDAEAARLAGQGSAVA